MLAALVCGFIGFTMDVTVTVPAQNYGYGISTPAITVNNIGKMDTRRNLLIAGGFLAVVGVLMLLLSPKETGEGNPSVDGLDTVWKENEIKRVKERMDQTNSIQPVPASSEAHPSFCDKCGAKVTPEMDFCQKCGTKQIKLQ